MHPSLSAGQSLTPVGFAGPESRPAPAARGPPGHGGGRRRSRHRRRVRRGPEKVAGPHNDGEHSGARDFYPLGVPEWLPIGRYVLRGDGTDCNRKEDCTEAGHRRTADAVQSRTCPYPMRLQSLITAAVPPVVALDLKADAKGIHLLASVLVFDFKSSIRKHILFVCMKVVR